MGLASTPARLTFPIIEGLDSDRYNITIFTRPEASGQIKSEVSRLAEARHINNIFLNETLGGARQTIADTELNVLYYPEIGMDKMAYFLAHAQLAPIQCTTWGHPETTGISTVTHFLSNGLIERDHNGGDYKEELVLFKNAMPQVLPYPEPFDPGQKLEAKDDKWAELAKAGNILEDAKIYMCAQQALKLHPDFDKTIAQILKKDPNSHVVFLKNPVNTPVEDFMERFATVMDEDQLNRIHFSERVPGEQWMYFTSHADVMLDPHGGFGAGVTALEGFNVGVLTVTLYTGKEMMREAVVQGFYRQAGIEGLTLRTQEEYVNRAIEIANSPDLQREYAEKLKAVMPVLFDPKPVVEEFQNILEEKLGPDLRPNFTLWDIGFD